jgi:hypothetical protein
MTLYNATDLESLLQLSKFSYHVIAEWTVKLNGIVYDLEHITVLHVCKNSILSNNYE